MKPPKEMETVRLLHAAANVATWRITREDAKLLRQAATLIATLRQERTNARRALEQSTADMLLLVAENGVLKTQLKDAKESVEIYRRAGCAMSHEYVNAHGNCDALRKENAELQRDLIGAQRVANVRGKDRDAAYEKLQRIFAIAKSELL